MSERWAQPSRRSRRGGTPSTQDGESLLTRGLAVLIAVPLFEFSLYLGLALLLASPRMAAYTWISLPWLFHLIYCAVVLLVAGWYGMHGITELLGHLFLTHNETMRNPQVTLGLWSVLGAATLVAYVLQS